jgi:hypothetical protein
MSCQDQHSLARNDVSARSRMTLSDISTRLRNVEKRRPGIVALAAALLTGGIVIGAILLQGRETETAPEPSVTLHQCGSVQDNANRLTCYDEVANQTSLRSAKDTRRMSFGELFGAMRNNQTRDILNSNR